MCEGDRERVRRVVRARDFFKPQKGFNHHLHLMLVRSAVARQRLFYLKGGILVKPAAIFNASEQDNSSRLRDVNTRRYVVVEKSSSSAISSGWNFSVSFFTPSSKIASLTGRVSSLGVSTTP